MTMETYHITSNDQQNVARRQNHQRKSLGSELKLEKDPFNLQACKLYEL